LRNKIIVQYYKENIKKYGKTLVFAIDIAHCIKLEVKHIDWESCSKVLDNGEKRRVLKKGW